MFDSDSMFDWNEGATAFRKVACLDWLKTAMLSEVAGIHRALMKGKSDGALDALASLVIVTYTMARQLGIPFEALDEKIRRSLSENIKQEHELERWYGDLSALMKYLVERDAGPEREAHPGRRRVRRP